MSTQLLHNFISIDEVDQLINYFKNQPYTATNYTEVDLKNVVKTKYKNSNYDQKNSLVYNILHDKINSIVGDHQMSHGSLLESHYPFQIHVDTLEQFDTNNFYNLNQTDQYLNIALLISLNEHPSFNTVFFDLDTPKLVVPDNPPDELSLVSQLYPDLKFDHHNPIQNAFIKQLTITDVYRWKAGSAVIWPRSQVHCSSNFYGHGLIKNALVLFL
jgi:hypothetical protein